MTKQLQKFPIISIIVPVFNAEKFLIACIESILSQSYSNWELILVNDGSSDNSPRICDTYAIKDSRIKVIHKDNQGVSKARNSGLEIASGEYICFIDSDDAIDLHLFENVLPYIEKQIDCIVYGYDRIHNGKLEKFILPYQKESCIIGANKIENFIWELKFYNLFVPLWNKIYKRSIIEKNNLRNERDITINEDLIFNQRFFHYIITLSYVNIPLYHYTLFSSDNCLSKRICDPYTLLKVSRIISETSFQNSSCKKLSIFDKYYYWDFLRLAYLNAFHLSKYGTKDILSIINIFISYTRKDPDYNEYTKRLGKIKRYIYMFKSKFIIYIYHKLYK